MEEVEEGGKEEMYKKIEELLLERVLRFMNDNEITCDEAIYQCDHVIENAYEFIDDLYQIVEPLLPPEEGE